MAQSSVHGPIQSQQSLSAVGGLRGFRQALGINVFLCRCLRFHWSDLWVPLQQDSARNVGLPSPAKEDDCRFTSSVAPADGRLRRAVGRKGRCYL